MDWVHAPNMLKKKLEHKGISFHCWDAFFGVVLCSYLIVGECPWNYALWDIVLESIDFTERMLNWVQSSPAGFKLNDQVSKFLTNCFQYQLNLCRIYVKYFGPEYVYHLPFVAPLFGLSTFVAAFVDLINILTIHMRCFHLYSKLLFKMFFTGMTSCYYAFTGKKYNPLRNRIDEAEIGFSHRLFATFLFLLLLFLLPTMVIYCLVFSGLYFAMWFFCEGLIVLTKGYMFVLQPTKVNRYVVYREYDLD